MLTLLPLNSLFAAPLRGSAKTIDGWQFTLVDPIRALRSCQVTASVSDCDGKGSRWPDRNYQ